MRVFVTCEHLDVVTVISQCNRGDISYEYKFIMKCEDTTKLWKCYYEMWGYFKTLKMWHSRGTASLTIIMDSF